MSSQLRCKICDPQQITKKEACTFGDGAFLRCLAAAFYSEPDAARGQRILAHVSEARAMACRSKPQASFVRRLYHVGCRAKAWCGDGGLQLRRPRYAALGWQCRGFNALVHELVVLTFVAASMRHLATGAHEDENVRSTWCRRKQRNGRSFGGPRSKTFRAHEHLIPDALHPQNFRCLELWDQRFRWKSLAILGLVACASFRTSTKMIVVSFSVVWFSTFISSRRFGGIAECFLEINSQPWADRLEGHAH